MVLTMNVGLSLLDVFEQNKFKEELRGWELNPNSSMFKMPAKAFFSEGKHYYKSLKERIEDSGFAVIPYFQQVAEVRIVSQWVNDHQDRGAKLLHRTPEKLWVHLISPNKLINLTIAEYLVESLQQQYRRNEVEFLFSVQSVQDGVYEPHIWYPGTPIQSPEWGKFGNEVIGVVPCSSGLDVLLSRRSKFGVYHSELGWIK